MSDTKRVKIDLLQSIPAWIDANKASFLPPVCNKLMHGQGQLKVMYVGGPNVRKDYHIEEGEELFYQEKGAMVLAIMEKGQPKDIRIEEGEIFVLPGRIPHSPQRFEDTVGLVIERERLPSESDGLRYYQPDHPTEPLWEKWFHCHDLGQQLGPVIKEYFSSRAYVTRKVQPGSVAEKPLVQVDVTTTVDKPVSLAKLVDEHLAIVGKEPVALILKSETKVHLHSRVQGAHTIPAANVSDGEVWLWQLRGKAKLASKTHGDVDLSSGDSFLVEQGSESVVLEQVGDDAVTLSIRMTPCPANKV